MAPTLECSCGVRCFDCIDVIVAVAVVAIAAGAGEDARQTRIVVEVNSEARWYYRHQRASSMIATTLHNSNVNVKYFEFIHKLKMSE